MTEGVITRPDGTRIRITAPNKEALILKARQLVNGVDPARQNTARHSGPEAFIRNAAGGFIDNVIGAGELLATLAQDSNFLPGLPPTERVKFPFDSSSIIGL